MPETYLVAVRYRDTDASPEYAFDAETPEEAVASVQERFDGDPEFSGFTAKAAEPLQDVLDRILDRVEEGANYSLSFKHESGSFGPVVVTDLDAMREVARLEDAIRPDGTIVLGIPFGTTPAYETPLPWMKKSEAKRLAKYLRVPYGES